MASAALEAYRFDEYAAACYRLHLGHVLRLVRGVCQAGAGWNGGAARRRRMCSGTILRLLHPAMPFVTEELWDRFGYGEPYSLIRTAWPEPSEVADAYGACRAGLGGAADL